MVSLDKREGKMEKAKKTTTLLTLIILLFSCLYPAISAGAKETSDEKDTRIEKIEWGKSTIYSGDSVDLEVTLKDKATKGMTETIPLPKKLHYQLEDQKEDPIVDYQLKKNKLTIQFKQDSDQKEWKIPLKVSSDKDQVCRTNFGLKQKKVNLHVQVKEEVSCSSSSTTQSSSTETSEDKLESSSTTSKTTNTTQSATTTTISTTSSSTSAQPTTSTTSAKEEKSSTTTDNKKQTTTTIEISDKKTKRPPLKKEGRQFRMSLNDEDVVDWISVDPSSVQDGERVTVHVHFSEKYDGQIQPGDTITIRLPHSGNLSLTGFNRTIQLVDTYGDTIGELNVSSDEAVIHFNENVIDKTHITGNVHFSCEARNTTQSSQGNVGKLTTNFGIDSLPNQTITITAPPYNTNPGVNPFYYKTGRMLPNDTQHVRWWLTGNMNREVVFGDVYIVDEIQPGQEMDWNSFQISFKGGYLNGETLSLKELENRGIGTVYHLGPNQFVLRLLGPYVQYSTFTATYLTKITAPEQPEFKNNSTIYYQTIFEDHFLDGFESDMTVKNINVSGDVDDGKKGYLELTKVDSENNQALSGAKFTLINQETHKKYISTTDKNGYIRWDKLPHGNYLLKETVAPNGYILNKKVYHLTLDKQGVKIKNGDSYMTALGHHIVMKNDKKQGGTPLLPNTGGYGIGLLLIVGGTLLLLATILKRKLDS